MSWVFILCSLAGFLTALSYVNEIADGNTVRFAFEWVPFLDVTLSFFIDGLSLLFVTLITGIGFFVGLYAQAYMKGYEQTGRFFFYLVLFQASMLGLVLSDNIITLFVFWELTTVSSFLLIGYDHTSEKARRNAWQALLVTGAGGLALLAGLILLAGVGGSWEMSELITKDGLVQESPYYLPILILVLIGAFTKSAQVPFHFWLPNAMAAPTPVSAYLHSATMVKAGIYLLARVHPTLGGTPEWMWILTIFGAATAVWASIVALRQTDLKMALAYTTVMALGTLTMFLGAEITIAIAAAVTFLIVHALYKCALFLIIGIIDHETGTREADRLGGLAKAMPITTIAVAAASFSMAGFPPFLGFISKELKYEGALAVASEPVLVATAAMLANALMVAIAGIVAIRPFLGQARQTDRIPNEPPIRMWFGPLTLAFLGLAFGLVPPVVADGLIQPAVSAIGGHPTTVKLALWHGINLPLLLSVATFTLGVTIYMFHVRIRAALINTLNRLPVTGDSGYDAAKNGLVWLAKAQTKILQNGSLRRYLMTIFAITGAATLITLFAFDGIRFPSEWPDMPAYEWGIVMLIAAGAVIPAVTTGRLTAICGLGIVGAGIALIYLFHGAPDVALTQLLVEILFIVIVAVVMLKLPRYTGLGHSGPGGRTRDAVIALATGVAFTLTMLAVLDAPFSLHLTEYFTANSVPEAYGRNIVNVILVDFRALDTFGEILVVAIAGLAAYGLIKLRPNRGRKS
jgi:multicomponent Na+:H+ antiporter subunit A